MPSHPSNPPPAQSAAATLFLGIAPDPKIHQPTTSPRSKSSPTTFLVFHRCSRLHLTPPVHPSIHSTRGLLPPRRPRSMPQPAGRTSPPPVRLHLRPHPSSSAPRQSPSAPFLPALPSLPLSLIFSPLISLLPPQDAMAPPSSCSDPPGARPRAPPPRSPRQPEASTATSSASGARASSRPGARAPRHRATPASLSAGDLDLRPAPSRLLPRSLLLALSLSHLSLSLYLPQQGTAAAKDLPGAAPWPRI